MPGTWQSFAVMNFVQLVLLIIHALYERKLSDIPRVLRQGVLGGLVLGLFFDLVLGKQLGLFSYVLGFNLFFLTLNSTVSYGLFVANTLLMQRARLAHFFAWTMLVGAVSEFTNLSLHLWSWRFASLPHIDYLFVLPAGYFAVAVLVAAFWHAFLGYPFLFLNDLISNDSVRTTLCRKGSR